ncbi:MAG: NAD kinase [Cyclobacteriaceae bacterium]|jgi:NAD+ kinase|nr:NAD kinase [Cyclobacteriaceae bacterium]
MRVGVHGKEISTKKMPIVERVLELIHESQAQPVLSEALGLQCKKEGIKSKFDTFKPGDNLRDLTFMLSLGGDGTLLETVNYVGQFMVPVLGINLGRLGFLATINQEEITLAIQKLFEGAYQIDERAMLRLETNRDLFGQTNFALNDLTIMKKDSAAMITVHAYIDGAFLNSYWADGLIVSTPTGSTGYNLSCGGPLVFPRSGSFVLTPVSPHNLTTRPIIVPDQSIIKLEVEGRSKQYLITLDSRVATGDLNLEITIMKENFKARLIQLEGQHYFKTLRQKLNWGFDIRN